VRVSKKLRTFLIFLTLALFLYLGIKYVFPLLTPFIVGLVIAYLIEPSVKWMENKIKLPKWVEERINISRPVAVLIVLIITFIVGGMVLTFVFSRLYLEIRELLVDLPGRLMGLAKESDRLVWQLRERLQVPDAFWEQLRLRPENLIETASGFIQDFLQEALNFFRGFPFFIINLFLSALAAYFFSRDKKRIITFVLSLVPDKWREPAVRLHSDVVLSALNFLKIQITLAMISGLLAAFFLGLFGFVRSGLLGALIGVLDLLPMVGPTTLFLPWIGWNLVNANLGRGLILVVILLIILAVRQLAEVRLVGKRLGLHPLMAMFSIYLGLRIFGVYGVFIGPVLFVMMRSFYYGILPLLEHEGFLSER